MTQYNMLIVKLSNSQLNNLKSAIKNRTKVPLNLSSNIAGDSNDKNNVCHKLLLINIQSLKTRKPLANGSSANIELSKTQLHKIRQLGEVLGRFLRHLLKTS